MNPFRSKTLLVPLLLTVAAGARAAGPSPTPTPAETKTPAVSPAASPGAAMPTPDEAPAGPNAVDLSADAPPAPTPDPAAIKDVAAMKSADALWDYIKKYSNLDDVQPDPALGPQEQVTKAQVAIGAKISHLHPALNAFLKDYPKDARRFDAKLMRLLFLKDTDKITNQETTDTLHEVAGAAEASNEARQQARAALLENVVQTADPSTGLSDAVDKELTAYEKDFPDDENGARFVTLRLRFLGDAGAEKTNALLETLSKSPNKATAAAAKAQLALRTEPLDLKLTTIDDKQIDLAKERGKVVLLDFWATWCVPCMIKLPEILAIHKKYDAKDFEIIGVSLDQDREALEKVIKQKGMPWPEINDPQGFEGKIPVEFGIEAIPSAWLVDRTGHAHAVPMGADLDAEIAKLIAPK